MRVELACTVLKAAHPAAGSPATIAGWDEEGSRQAGRHQQLTGVVIVLSLVIVGCALAAGVVAGLAGRGCPFSRLAGTPLSALHRAVTLESAVPLLVTAVVAIGTGFATSAMFITAPLRYSLVNPGLCTTWSPWPASPASPGIVAATIPLPCRVTGPGVAVRNEWLTVAREQPYGFTMITDKPDDGGVSPIAFYLDRGSGVPTYLQFVHQVDHALRLGYLRAGDQLPRIKDVTRTLAVNPDTVMKAYRELELRGIAAGRPGVGTFITTAPDVAGLREMAELQGKLTGWLAEATAAGIDELGLRALFTAALQDFLNAGGANPGPARKGDVA